MVNRVKLIEKIKERKNNLNITIKDLANLSNVSTKTISKFLKGEDIKLSTLEKIVFSLGLDLAGNEIVDIETLKRKKAEEKAKYIVSLVQDTSLLEMQGLTKKRMEELIEFTKKELLTTYAKNLWA